ADRRAGPREGRRDEPFTAGNARSHVEAPRPLGRDLIEAVDVERPAAAGEDLGLVASGLLGEHLPAGGEAEVGRDLVRGVVETLELVADLPLPIGIGDVAA